jgi:hypothetical protein
MTLRRGQSAKGVFLDDIEYGDIARLLCNLSKRQPFPNAISVPPPSEFEAADVRFDDNTWLFRVAEVQGWLRLEDVLDRGGSELEQAKVLFNQLGDDTETLLYSVVDGVVNPTEAGAHLLEIRLSRADERSQQFVDAIDEGASLAAASIEWDSAWDEPESSEPPNIKATVSTWAIVEFTDRARENDLDLNPSYQREYIWSNPDSQKLIESVLRGIPLPSIILASMSGNGGDKLQIVDGKQRLTSLLRFVGAHPSAIEFAKSKKDLALFDADFRKFAKKHQLTTEDIRKHYLPFKTGTFDKKDPLYSISGKYYHEIKEVHTQIGGKPTTVRKIFATNSSEYRIPILKYEDTDVRDIHKVFTIYNKQGVKLNAEEIRNAVYNHLKVVQLMLFIGGDRNEPAMAEYAVAAGIDPTLAHAIITDMGFSIARFRRTKILLWMLSALLHSTRSRGQLRAPSTASHIDSFLDTIDPKLQRLRSIQVLTDLARALVDAIELHANAEQAWHPKFQSKKEGSKWEELGAVASIGACLVLVLLNKQDVLLERRAAVREVTRMKNGPGSTQNKTQWKHIADSLLSILEAVDVSAEEAKIVIENKFGTSAIDGLIELRAMQVDG